MIIHTNFFNKDNNTLSITSLLFSSKKTTNRPFYMYVFFPYNDTIADEISKFTAQDLENIYNKPGFISGNAPKDKTKHTDSCTALFYKIEIIPNISTNINLDKVYKGQYPKSIYIYVDLPPRSAIPSNNILKFDAKTSNINNIYEMMF